MLPYKMQQDIGGRDTHKQRRFFDTVQNFISFKN